ncbi:hypothetical protein D9757_011775 [Collybiopsis confluens]|uniref:F-box domain-containing protein n=1 Tax=Collybiopsis confluens TaxID=2823264 RepID=A0A8H5LQ09_9AGAR|nr:hypothetical protein D9757_011775 [Collybiopsis confluens]
MPAQRRIEGQIFLDQNERVSINIEISKAEDEIERLESKISELQRQKASKLVELSFLHNVLAPIRRIPPEILSEIFCLFCYSNVYNDYTSDWFFPEIRHLNKSIGILMAVGIAWKNVVDATPALWSRFALSGRDIWVKDAWLERWLSRSHGHPLDLRLSLYQGGQDSVVRECIVVSKILEFHSQIRSLYLVGDILAFLPVCHLSRNALPMLEEVHLLFRSYEDDLNARLPQRQEAFGRSLSLRRLEIDDREAISILERLSIPLHNLEKLKIVSSGPGIGPTIYLRSLIQCQDLKSLHLDFGWDAADVPNTSFTLRLLKYLEIKIECLTGNRCHYNLLQHFSAPNLDHLHLHLSGFNHASFNLISSFQHRSTGFSLKSLTLDFQSGAFGATKRFRALLSFFPKVSYLCISSGSTREQSILGDIVRILVVEQSVGSGLLPQLAKFEMSVQTHRPMEYLPRQLTQMILSRQHSHSEESAVAASGSARMPIHRPSRLKKVTLRGFDFPSEDCSALSKVPGLQMCYKV